MRAPASRPWVRRACLAFALALCPALFAQTFDEGISVTVVEIPVEVLSDGRPVQGLTRDDFIVLDRNRPVEIVGFEVVDLSVSSTRPQEQEMRAEPVTEAPPRGRQFLLMFDLDFIQSEDSFDMVRALRGARQMLREQLHPLDRAAVAIYSGASGARMIAGFTDDRDRANTAIDFVHALLDRKRDRAAALLSDLQGIEEQGEDPAKAVSRLMRQFGSSAALVLSAGDLPMASLQGYNEIAGAGGGIGPGDEGGSDGLMDFLNDSSDVALEPGLDRIRRFAEAMAELTTLLRSVPEPKHLVYFSKGFPNSWIETTDIRARAQNRLQPLVHSMRASGWRVQAVDTEGVPGALGVGRSSASDSDPGATLAQTGSDRFGPTPTGVGFDAQTLFQLANDTGGELFDNYNNLGKATERLIERSAVTYLLVIQPEVAADGGYHRLEVQLASRRPGTNLRHRPGYNAPKPTTQLTALERRLDLAERLLSDQSIADLPVSSLAYPRLRGSDLDQIPLLLEIAGDALLGETEDESRLEIQAFVLDDIGEVRDLLAQTLNLDLERLRPRLEKGPLRFLGSLRVPDSPHRIRVHVRHLPSGREYLRTLPSNPRPNGTGAPSVLPPMILHPQEPPTLTLLDAGSDTALARAFSFGEVAVQPDLEAALHPGEARHVLLTLFPGSSGAPSVTARVLAADGSVETHAELEWLQRTEGTDSGSLQLLGALRVGDLAAGDYRLEVEMAGDDKASVASSAFSVVR